MYTAGCTCNKDNIWLLHVVSNLYGASILRLYGQSCVDKETATFKTIMRGCNAQIPMALYKFKNVSIFEISFVNLHISRHVVFTNCWYHGFMCREKFAWPSLEHSRNIWIHTNLSWWLSYSGCCVAITIYFKIPNVTLNTPKRTYIWT